MKFVKFFKNLIISSAFISTLISPIEVKADLEKLSKEEILQILKNDYIKNSPQDFYIIDSGDQIEVSISGDYPELTSRTFINGEGYLILPKIERLFVRGLTLEELNILLNEVYIEIVKYPDVSTRVLSYRPVKFFVDGEVNDPGLHTLKGSLSSSQNTSVSDMFRNPEPNFFESDTSKLDPSFKNQNTSISYYFPTLFDALRSSGGINELSDLSNIKVIRKNSISRGGGKIEAIIDGNKSFTDKNGLSDFRIYDGDFIKISSLVNGDQSVISKAIRSNLNPKYIRVLVAGRVKVPGTKILGRLSTLNDAIDISGGTSVIKGPVSFLSYNNDGTIEKRKIKYSKRSKRGSFKNPYLAEGDMIIVGESFLSNSTEFLKEITAPFQGLYSTYSLIEVLSN